MADILISPDDGYTLDFTLPPRGRFPAISGRYRPAVDEEVREYQRSLRLGGRDESQAARKLLLGHLKAWDVSEKGSMAPITADTLARLPNPLVVRLVDVVTDWSEEARVADAKN